MSYCEHCEGQRFDRARVLRALRQVRKDVREMRGCRAEDVLELALRAIRELEIPHLEVVEDDEYDVVH
jgi:BMFP domain-containing protein YqiC